MTNQIESAAAAEPANVLFLGDSIAVGVGASSRLNCGQGCFSLPASQDTAYIKIIKP